MKTLLLTVNLILSAQLFASSDFQLVAESNEQWTGIGVTSQGEIFVNFPRWSNHISKSVAKLRFGKAVPFPSISWNDWKEGEDISEQKFVAVQSVVVDKYDHLWVLDTGNPQFKGVINGAARLFVFDSVTGSLLKTYKFNHSIAPKNSYLNDLRIDHKHNFVYLTDSGLGALISLNIKTGESKRFLAQDQSTKSEDTTLRFPNGSWLKDGKTPQVHSDGIAFDQRKDLIYYQALTGRTLYSVPAVLLRDFTRSDVRQFVKKEFQVGPSDGLHITKDGSVLLTSLEESALRKYNPATKKISMVHQSSKIAWPDSIALGKRGAIYFTTSQIHLSHKEQDSFKIFKIRN